MTSTNFNLETVTSLCSEFKHYKRIIEEAEAVKKSLQAKLITMLEEIGETKLIAGEYKITYSSHQRQDIDKKRLEEEYKDIHDMFLKPPTTVNRLLVN